MNICYKRNNEFKRKRLKYKCNNGYKKNKLVKETKINISEAKIAYINRKYLIKNINKSLSHFKLENFLRNLIILYLKMIFSLIQCSNQKLLLKVSEVTIKINTKGNITILSDNFFQRYNPLQIYINGYLQENITNKYYFNKTSIINLIWNNTIESTENMFIGCNKITEIDLSNFDTSQVTNMSCMFYNCSSLSSLNLSNFNTSKVVDMNRMFIRCSSLKELDLTNFDTSQVTNMELMFYKYSSANTLNLSNFITSKVNNMYGMFYGCESLNSLNLSNFDTSQVVNMSKMFNGCSKLIELDISNFDTSNVNNMTKMFFECSKLTTLDISNFKTSKVKSMDYMFYSCAKLKSLNLYNFNTSLVKDMSYMFEKCRELKNLNISSFDTSQVTKMKEMFYNCFELNPLNLTNFNTQNVRNMDHMFYNCTSLTSLNLSNFDASKVTNMNAMFARCYELKFLDLSNFNTPEVKDISYIFFYCTSLSSLDISKFNTSKATDMNHMFYECFSLNSLNLSNLDTSKAKEMENMFYNCSSLISLDLSNFDSSQAINMNSMFYNCTNLTVLNVFNFDISKVNNLTNMFYRCQNLKYINYSILNSFNKLNNIFSLTHPNLVICGQYNYDYSIDLNLFLYEIIYCKSNKNNRDIQNNSICYIKNSTIYNNTCHICGENFFIDEIDLINFNNNNSYINCIDEDLVHESCYYTCKTCDIRGNESYHNCKECKNDFKYEMNITNSIYKNCFNFSIINNENNTYLSINNFSFDLISEKYYNEISDSINLINTNNFNDPTDINNSIDSINSDYSNDFTDLNNISNSNNSNNLINPEESMDSYDSSNSINSNYLNNYDDSKDSMDSDNSSNSYESSNSANLSDSNNLNNLDYLNHTNNLNDLFSTIYSSESIIRLVASNSIEIENRTEIIEQIINDLINEFNMTELDSGNDKKIVDKDKIIIFTSTDNQKNNEEKNNITMNLGQCENMLKRDYNISNNDSLYILQIISEEEGMKIPKIEYEVYYPLIGNNLTKLNLTSCKDTKIEISISVKINGTLDKYNLKSDYYNDICTTTTSESGTDITLKDRKNEFIDNNMSLCEENCDLIEYNFTKGKAKCSCDIKLSIPENYDIKFNKNDFLKSFIDVKNMFNFNIIKCYKIFNIEKLMKNYGFFIVGSIIILYFLIMFIFIIYSYDKIKKDIHNIIFALKISPNPIKKNKFAKVENKNKQKYKNQKMKKYLDNNIKHKNKDKIIKSNEYYKLKSKSKYYRKQVTQNISKYSFNMKNQKNKVIMNEKQIILLKKDFELNSLNYIEAIKSDHRSYCGYYISLIKYNHPILFSFVPFDDYNSQIIKFFLFFFSFCLDFAINALFFTDDTMHKIYKDKGKFDLLYQIPQILYSTIISRIIDTFIRALALSQDNIVELKQIKKKENLKKIQNKIYRIIKIKFTLFFLSSFIILIFFGYYITCFCGIYKNTQIHLIKDSIMSLIISLLIPFILYIIPGIFRIPSLRVIKPNRIVLYKISQFIENWFC